MRQVISSDATVKLSSGIEICDFAHLCADGRASVGDIPAARKGVPAAGVTQAPAHVVDSGPGDL